MRSIRVNTYRANNKLYTFRIYFIKSLYSFRPLKIIKLNTFTSPPLYHYHPPLADVPASWSRRATYGQRHVEEESYSHISCHKQIS